MRNEKGSLLNPKTPEQLEREQQAEAILRYGETAPKSNPKPKSKPNKAANEPIPVSIGYGVDVYKPHGLLKDIVNYMRQTAHRDLPLAYIANGLQILAALAATKQVKGIDGVKLNVTTLVLAETASGKDWPQQVAKEACIKFGVEAHGAPRSDKDLILNALNAQANTYFVDEAHGLFAGTRDKNAPTYLKNIAPLMLEMTTSQLMPLSGTHKREVTKELECHIKALSKNEGSEDRIQELQREIESLDNGIESPYVNLALTSTPAKFTKYVDEDATESGLLGRSLVFNCGQGASPIKERKKDSICFESMKSSVTSRELTCSNDARTILTELLHWADHEDRRDHVLLGALYRRFYERVLVVASLLAVGTGEVTCNDVRYAAAIVKQHIKGVMELLQENNATSSSDMILLCKNRIIDVVKKTQYIEIGRLRQRVMKLKKLTEWRDSRPDEPCPFGRAIEDMTQANQIVLTGKLVSTPE